jgi:hypothetical protein
MEMIQTYQGHFLEDGRFIADGRPVKLPTKRRIIISVLDDETVESGVAVNTEARQRQAAAVKKFITDIAALGDEDNVMTDADWDELANLRSRTNAGFHRAVDI